MADDHVSSGIDTVGAVPWGTHFCQFYDTAADLAGTLVPFFKAGLYGNERCLWVTAPPLRAPDATDALRAAVPDLDRRLARGQIEIIDHGAWHQTAAGEAGTDVVIGGWLRRKAAALADGYAGLRLAGNTTFLAPEDRDALEAYEREVHACSCRQRVLALCSYCARRCDAGGAIDAVQNHDFAVARRRDAWTVVEGAAARPAGAAPRRADAALEARVARRTADLAAALAEREALLAEKDMLLREVHHRVKNNLQVAASLIHLKARGAVDPTGREALAETLRRIKAMALVHEALYRGPDTTGRINFAAYLAALAEATAEGYGMSRRVAIEVAPGGGVVGLDTAVPLGLAAAEAIANAFKHAFPEGRSGRLRIAFRAPTETRDGELTVCDDGIGVPAPRAAAPRPRGAGLALAEALARQVGGRASITWGPGAGPCGA